MYYAETNKIYVSEIVKTRTTPNNVNSCKTRKRTSRHYCCCYYYRRFEFGRRTSPGFRKTDVYSYFPDRRLFRLTVSEFRGETTFSLDRATLSSANRITAFYRLKHNNQINLDALCDLPRTVPASRLYLVTIMRFILRPLKFRESRGARTWIGNVLSGSKCFVQREDNALQRTLKLQTILIKYTIILVLYIVNVSLKIFLQTKTLFHSSRFLVFFF